MAKSEGVADKVGHFVDFGALVIMDKDDGILLFLKVVDFFDKCHRLHYTMNETKPQVFEALKGKSEK